MRTPVPRELQPAGTTLGRCSDVCLTWHCSHALNNIRHNGDQRLAASPAVLLALLHALAMSVMTSIVVWEAQVQ